MDRIRRRAHKDDSIFRRLLNRIMARAEVRMSYDTPDSGEAYDITID